jgi:hypothetical protein
MTLKMASDELDHVLRPVWQSDSMHGCTAIWIFQVGSLSHYSNLALAHPRSRFSSMRSHSLSTVNMVMGITSSKIWRHE